MAGEFENHVFWEHQELPSLNSLKHHFKIILDLKSVAKQFSETQSPFVKETHN